MVEVSAGDGTEISAAQAENVVVLSSEVAAGQKQGSQGLKLLNLVFQ